MKITLLVTIAFLLTVGTAIACYKPEITPIPTIQPSQEPIISDVVVTVEPTISIALTATPSATPTTSQSANLSDNRSDGLSSCPDCTRAHPNSSIIIPTSAPNTGRAE